MLSCILVEPESPGNIGSIARLMMNFGIEGPLILVNPPNLDDDAYKMACNASRILEDALIVKTFEEALALVDFSISTSRESGDQYNINRISLLPSDLERAIEINGRVSVVFGRESSGLTNAEISKTDMLVSIPSDMAYPTLNVSHAAAIIFYEFFKLSEKNKRPVRLEGASGQEKGMLFSDFDSIVDILERRDYRRRNFKLIFRRVIARSFITSREAYTLKGILSKMLSSLDKKD
ncbi:MAG: TrmJ/YjtD family RNA methyltransferase [Candidatus Methanofastidiosa archaeon]|nr:TrmJ/YjtD family RNA methyltransferase [Candidatus Methanofastidiosa archaeon]